MSSSAEGVSGEAPDDGERTHDAVQDGDAAADAETVVRRVSGRKKPPTQTHDDVIGCLVVLRVWTQ